MMLAAHLEALLFLAPEPVSIEELADALQTSEEAVAQAARRNWRPTSTAAGSCCSGSPAGSRSRRIRTPRRRRGGCSPRPRTPALTPAQAETLAIVAYLQPVSRPEVAQIRGVASESATAALVERGLIEEAGRSQFGAVLYRSTPLFLKLFGLDSPDELPSSRSGTQAPRRRPRCATGCCAPARPATGQTRGRAPLRAVDENSSEAPTDAPRTTTMTASETKTGSWPTMSSTSIFAPTNTSSAPRPSCRYSKRWVIASSRK